MLSIIHTAIITLHILAGITALLVAPVAMIVHKGGTAHRRWGKVYFWAMFAICLSAVGMLFFRFNPFLAGVTALSFYSALTGYRVLYRKRALAGAAPIFDRMAAWLALAAGMGLTGWGINALINPPAGFGLTFAILPLVFGIFVFNQGLVDLRLFRTPPVDRQWWWYYHMERMLGAYIATLTAFLVQTVTPRLPAFDLVWIVWVAPGVIGGVLIGVWIKHYRRKFTPSQVVAPALAVSGD